MLAVAAGVILAALVLRALVVAVTFVCCVIDDYTS